MKLTLVNDYNSTSVDTFTGTPSEVEAALRGRWKNMLKDIPVGNLWSCLREITRTYSVTELEGEDVPPRPAP